MILFDVIGDLRHSSADAVRQTPVICGLLALVTPSVHIPNAYLTALMHPGIGFMRRKGSSVGKAHAQGGIYQGGRLRIALGSA